MYYDKIAKMRASRLISLLLRLHARGRLTAVQVAAELEVSVRTIYRDIDELSAAGIPVVAERGRSGGFKLLDGFKAQLGALTEAELETLFLSALPEHAAELGLAGLLESARTKLVARLPRGVDPDRLAARIHLDTTGWFRTAEPVPLLPVISQAVRAARFLKIRYATDEHRAARTVGPLGLVLKGGVWYLVAQSGESLRTYRIARVSAAEISEQAYARPPRFDLARHWSHASREFEVASYRMSATVRLSARGRALLLDLLGPYVAAAGARTMGEADRRGWARCTFPLESLEFGSRELMRLGADVVVESPPELRAHVEQALRRTLRNYRVRGAGRPG